MSHKEESHGNKNSWLPNRQAILQMASADDNKNTQRQQKFSVMYYFERSTAKPRIRKNTDISFEFSG